MTVTENTDALAPVVPRDNAGLLTMLDKVADEGWDGPTGRRLLTFIRERLARPLAVGAGLRGLAASQAEAWRGRPPGRCWPFRTWAALTSRGVSSGGRRSAR